MTADSLWRRTANARATAMMTASTEVMAPRRTLLSAQSRKRSQGSTDQSAASGRSMKNTGATKPMSTGSRHTSQASAQRQPRRRSGCASAELARPVLPVTKRMRRWARSSSCSSSTTSTSRKVASCAAAMRLSMDSQAL
ncbi:hypothetical protein GY14_11450 [Delftia tsuruhatensis]|nr:hypothetical protein GY14_11450 [Delftia tsuruhatensis]